ncbi:calmodulin-binding protein 60 D-like isoform X2 [Primulina huaijiensis]|uniref:calmodulin-binding protein 60 D-like isoform X2 n=1 Tax=Primulina huaijiensis TaxID=1492673 RepID=UPI003CC75970
MEAHQVHKTVEDKFGLERIETGILTETKRMLTVTDSNSTPVPKTMELRFSKKVSQPTLACHEIKGEGSTCIEVVLYDSSTGKRIEVGPVAFAYVELVVLAQGTDDWTGEGFNEKIVPVEGKKLPLLTVNMCKLEGGVCVLKGVKFRHHATQVKPTVFRLGARIVGTFEGIIVKEAKTESFAVKCYRNKYFKKNEVPTLTDKISVMKNIQRRGKIEERLQAKGIDNVEKFLIHLLINPQELKNIARSKGKKWEGTINHARKSQSGKMYWYFNYKENSGVIFDIFGKLQWMYSQGEYAATSMLSQDKKVVADNLLSSAFEHWEDVTSFDDPDSLQQHLEAVIRAAETIHESYNIEAPDPILLNNQGIPISDMNSLALGVHDIGFVDNFPWPPDDLLFSEMFTNFDIGSEVYGPRIEGTGSAMAESKEVENDVLRMKMNLNNRKK